MPAGKIKKVLQICLPTIAAVSTISVALAQSSNPGWTDDLSSQLMISEQCEVISYSSILEKTKNGQVHYLARAQCSDGREFYGERTGDMGKFMITTCNVSVC